MQKFIKFLRNWKNWSITIWAITIKIEQWLGPTMGIGIIYKPYSFGLFCKAFMNYRLRKQLQFKEPIWKLIFSVKRNVRMAVLVWHTDITILGFTFQFEKYQPEFI